MQLNGSDILMECLLEQGVDTIFGYPGGAVLNIYDALYKYQDKITHYLVSHEQSAAHAADGYARVTGKAGVCLATSGPGATNLVTGIATAYMDSIPMVAITGNVTTALLGRDSFQEVDIAGITMPITKHNFIVKDITKLAETVRRAFYIAQEGRPGPVLIDITKDVTAAVTEYEPQSPKPIVPLTDKIKDADIAEAVRLIDEAKRPMLYGGGGIISSGAADEFLQFAEKIDSPVGLSAMGIGSFPSSHRCYTGLIGMHGTTASNLAASKCDLLIAVGARFSDRVATNAAKFAPHAKILHIDVDPAEMGKNVRCDAHIIGDIKEVLKRLLPAVNICDHEEWLDQVNQWKTNRPLKYNQEGDELQPQYIMERISALTKGESIISTEVGQNQMWAWQFIEYDEPRTLLTSGGLGTMGYGLGAAIGAQVARPDKRVFNIAGDGCFRMNHIELATAVEYNLPVIEVILNNHVLGMVRQWQKIFYGGRYSHTTLATRTTDFVKLAEAYGAAAFTIKTASEVDEVLKKALAINGPVVINCEIDCNERVLPMIPAGASVEDMIVE